MTAKPIERFPVAPLPPNYRPPLGRPYRVQTGDTWENVAERYSVNVQNLLHFNFKTSHPDEVNWYLRTRVGCVKSSPSGLNWAFSADARPGIIYLPAPEPKPEPVKTTTTKKRVGKITSPLALEFDGPSSPLDTIGKMFDVFQLIDIGLAIVGTELAAGVILTIGSVTAPIGPFVLIGGMEEAAVNELRKAQMKRGMAMGVVLAADGRSISWIKANNGNDAYFKTNPVHTHNHKAYGKQLQGMYNTAFQAGYGHGSQFTEEASKNLFAYCLANMGSYMRSEFTGDPKTWPARKWEQYYSMCAAALEKKVKLK